MFQALHFIPDKSREVDTAACIPADSSAQIQECGIGQQFLIEKDTSSDKEQPNRSGNDLFFFLKKNQLIPIAKIS